MPKARRTSGSLASGIVRITFIVGSITVAAALMVTIAESYRLSARQSQERIGAYLQVMRSEVAARLSAAVTLNDHAATTIQDTSPERVTTRLLASQYIGAADMLAGLVLLNADGTVAAAYPALRSPFPTAAVEFARRVGVTQSEVGHSDRPNRLTSVWVARRLRRSGDTSQTLVSIVRTEFLSSTVNRVASRADRRSAVVIDAGRPVATGVRGPMLRLPTAVYGELSEDDVGAVRLLAPSVGLMRGLWSPVEVPFVGDWRLLVVEPSQATILSSLQASIPTFVVLLVGGTIALGIAWVVARRLVYPLREIEAASYEAAKGAHVSPLRPGRDDEVGRLAEAFNAVGLRLNALQYVSRLLAGASRVDQVLDAVIEAIGHLLGSGMVAIYVTDDTEQSLQLARSSGGFTPPPGPVLRAHSGPFARALATESVQTPAPNDLPMHGWDIDETPCRVLVVPLIAATEQLGVIVILQHGRSEYSDAEVEMVGTFASQASIGITKSRLFEREIETRRVAELLRDVAEELVGPVAFGDALDSVGVVVSGALAGRTALFAFEDRDALGLPPAEDPELERTIIELADAALESGGSSRIVAPGTSEQADGLLARFGAAQVILARIEPDEPYRGAFAAFSAEPSFGSRDVEVVEGMTKIVTLAIDNAYFFERSRVRARNLETIFRISQAVGSSLELNVVLNRVLDVVQMIFAADAVSLMIYDKSKRVVTTAMARGAVSNDILHLEVAPGADLPGRVFSTREPMMLRDLRQNDTPLAGSAHDLGLNSLLSVPLLARGSAVGVLTVFSEVASAFDDEDMGLLQTFASQAALAIDTARLYSREHDVAEILQRSILPDEVPEFDEVDVATAYRPAGEEAEIGGDYYDLFRAPAGDIVIAVADVCGKGVEAATKTSMLKYSVRALVIAGFGPAECLDEVNRMVATKGDPSDILSLWLGFLDAKAGTLRWANGGHPPSLILHSGSREIVRLEPTGPILGATTQVRFEEEAVDVGAGDTILLYTDGVTETRTGNRFFGEGRVRRSLRYGGSAENVVAHLLDALKRFYPGELRDDVAIVAVRVKDGERRAE